jgi:leucyl aminopeptidase (aminopeptidase T)
MARANSLMQGAERGDAVLTIYAVDPGLMQDVDPELVAKVQRLTQETMKGYSARVMSNRINWCVSATVIPAWAKRVFPDGFFGEERDALAILALVGEGRDADAKKNAANFLKRYPSGTFSDKVRQAVAASPPDD